MKTGRNTLSRAGAALAALTGVGGLLLAGGGIAHAAGTTGTASVGITAGPLTLISAPNLTWSGTLNGTPLALSTTGGLDVSDATGSGAGWQVTLVTTQFTDTNGDTLPTSAASIPSAPTVACDPTATDCVPATASSTVSYPYAVQVGAAGAATTMFGANVGTGMGDQTVTSTFDLAVPSTAKPVTYTSTWTYTLESAP